MKRKLVCCFLFLSIFCLSIKAQTVNLPKKCLSILDKKFGGWKLAKVGITEGVQGHNLIKGDWNGDGKTDYAILIEYGKNILGNGSFEPAIWTIALMKQKNGYSFYKLEGGDSIALMKRGTRDYRYDTDRNFNYKNDAIFVGIGWAGSSNIWRKGKFISIPTSD